MAGWINRFGDYHEFINVHGIVVATVRIGRAGIFGTIIGTGEDKWFSHTNILTMLSSRYSKHKMKKSIIKAKKWCEENL